jgi:nucleotide-binding universal stress UspA family protein
MLATVLVPLDGSAFAEGALPIATRLVNRAAGRLYLTTADQPSPALVGPGGHSSNFDILGDECRLDDGAYLMQTATGLGPVGEGTVRVSLIEGPAGEAISAEAGRIGADLIVMATHGRNATGRVWLGSVADYVVRHAGRPVLLVKPPWLGADPVDHPIRNILVPLDPSDYSETILESVLGITRILNAKVTLLTIVAPRFGIAEPELPPPAAQHPAIVARRSDEAHARLKRLARFYAVLGVEVRTRVAVATTPAAGILEVLGEGGFDMVAMATHGAAGVRRMLAGSVADKVIQASRKPVLVFHPPAWESRR